MTQFNKGTFEVDFGIYGVKTMEGHHSDMFFVYKTKGNWTVCHKQSNMKLSNLSNKLLAKAKANIQKVESAFNWNGQTGLEIAANNNMTGKEFSSALFEALYN